jgi:hypothetical protein
MQSLRNLNDSSLKRSNAVFNSTRLGLFFASDSFQFSHRLGKTEAIRFGCSFMTMWSKDLSIPVWLFCNPVPRFQKKKLMMRRWLVPAHRFNTFCVCGLLTVWIAGLRFVEICNKIFLPRASSRKILEDLLKCILVGNGDLVVSL